MISERTRHNERGMAGSAPKIHQTAFGQHDDAPACGEYDMIHLRLDVVPLVLLNGSNIYFGIEVSNVTDDSLVLHSQHVVMRNDAKITGRGHEYVGLVANFVHGNHAITFHRRL